MLGHCGKHDLGLYGPFSGFYRPLLMFSQPSWCRFSYANKAGRNHAHQICEMPWERNHPKQPLIPTWLFTPWVQLHLAGICLSCFSFWQRTTGTPVSMPWPVCQCSHSIISPPTGSQCLLLVEVSRKGCLFFLARCVDAISFISVWIVVFNTEESITSLRSRLQTKKLFPWNIFSAQNRKGLPRLETLCDFFLLFLIFILLFDTAS